MSKIILTSNPVNNFQFMNELLQQKYFLIILVGAFLPIGGKAKYKSLHICRQNRRNEKKVDRCYCNGDVSVYLHVEAYKCLCNFGVVCEVRRHFKSLFLERLISGN